MRTGVRIAFASLLLTCMALPANAQLQAPRPCEMARAWAQANHDRLPRTYQEIVRLPTEYRKAAFSVLDNDVKSDLWRAHLELFAAGEGLDEEQRDVVLEAIQILAPDFFSDVPDKNGSREARLRLTGLIERAEKAFSRAEIAEIFLRLGPQDREIVLIDHGSKGVRSLVMPLPAIQCSCNRGSDFCGNGAGCGNGSSCSPTEGGCGWGWSQQCNGLCMIVEP